MLMESKEYSMVALGLSTEGSRVSGKQQHCTYLGHGIAHGRAWAHLLADSRKRIGLVELKGRLGSFHCWSHGDEDL